MAKEMIEEKPSTIHRTKYEWFGKNEVKEWEVEMRKDVRELNIDLNDITGESHGNE